MPTERQISWAKFRVSIVVVVASAIVTVLVYLLTGGTLLQPKATLYIYIPDASGVAPGSPVLVDGIGVGKVSSVRLSGSNQPNRIVQVALKVEANSLAQIPVDSIAEVGNATLLGDKFIGITSGTSAMHVRSGAEIAVKPQTTTLDLTGLAVELRTVDATLRDIQNGTSPLGQFVLGDDMYRNLVRRLIAIQKGLNALGAANSEVGGLLYTDQMYRRINGPLVALDQTLARLQAGQGALGRMLRDPAQYDQLQAALAGLSRSVAAVRSQPLVASDATYQQWNQALASLARQVDDLNQSPQFSSTETYDSLNGMALELRDTLREFQADPRKFMRMKLF